MSTLAAPRLGSNPLSSGRTVSRPVPSSAFHLLLTYALLLPMIFFAARGAFSIEAMSYNHPESVAYDTGSIAGQGSVLHSAELVVAFGIIVLAMFPVAKPLLAACGSNLLLLALPAWAILSAFWSQSPPRSVAFGTLALVLTVFGIYISTRFSPRQQMQVMVLVGLVAAVLSLFLVVALPKAGIDYKNATVGAQGIYPQKNICAIVTITLLTPAFFYEFKGRARKIKRAAYICMLVALILGTLARTGWLALALTLVFIVVAKSLRRVRSLERLLVVWFLPVVTVLIAWLVYSNVAEIARALGKDPSLSGRTTIWSVVFLSILKRPILGYGYAAFFIPGSGEARRLALAVGDPGLSNAENGVLQMWLEIGLVGVGMLLALLANATRNAVRCFNSETPNYAIWYMSILFLGLLSLIDGDKFLLPTALQTSLLALAYVGLANEARRVRSLKGA